MNGEGIKKLRLINVSWGYNGETEEYETNLADILCPTANIAWMREATIRLNAVAAGRFNTMANVLKISAAPYGSTDPYTGETIILAPEISIEVLADEELLKDATFFGVFGDPRWAEIPDVGDKYDKKEE